MSMAYIQHPCPVDIADIAAKHSLSVDAVCEEVERAVSDTLTRLRGQEVSCALNGSGMDVREWVNRFGELSHHAITADDVSGQVRQKLADAVDRCCAERRFMGEMEQYRHLAKTLISGEVVKFGKYDELFVSMDTGYETLTGICDVQQQPPLERIRYTLGNQLDFYVLAVRVAIVGDTPRLELPLSRTSKRLVEHILRDELGQRLADRCHIYCIRRVPGCISDVLSTQRLPHSAIKRSTARLGERIRIKWASLKR